MSGFRPCLRCPDVTACVARHVSGAPKDCAGVLAADRALGGASVPPATAAPRAEPPVELREAAEITVRHWRQLGARGFDAAITLLERVLAR